MSFTDLIRILSVVAFLGLPQVCAESKDERNFYEVLEDVLSDFEFDLKNGNVTGLKDISIRTINLSENIPPSFRSHIELLLTERILKTTKTHVISCPACRSKTASLNGDQVIVTSADSHPEELLRVARLAGVHNFLDTSFSYQSSGIVLSLTSINAEDNNVIWSKSYNSETSKASAFRRGVDFSQNDEARHQTEYTTTLQSHVNIYYLSEPNIPITTGCLGLGYRLMERYNNRKKEVGFELEYLADASTIVNKKGANATNLYVFPSLNLTLLFLHTWNFMGDEENFNMIRSGLTLGVGGTYASGFLGSVVRATYEWRLGKHSNFSLNLGYRPTAPAFIQGTQTGTLSGPEYGFGIGGIF